MFTTAGFAVQKNKTLTEISLEDSRTSDEERETLLCRQHRAGSVTTAVAPSAQNHPGYSKGLHGVEVRKC